MFSGGSVLWSSENTASSLMMQTNLMQNFSALLNHTYNLYGGVNVCRFCPQKRLLNPPVLILLAVAV